MRKITPFQPHLITPTFFAQYQQDPSVINQGRCFIWAYLAFKLFKSVQLWHTPNHAFVKYQKNFYDSQTLQGVSDWAHLPIHQYRQKTFPKYLLIAIRLSEKEFHFEWGNQLYRFDVSWSGLSEQARQVLRKYQ